MQSDMKLLKDRMKQMEGLVLEQKTLQERQRQRSLEKIREWDAFVKDAPRLLPSVDAKATEEDQRKEKMKIMKALETFNDDAFDQYYRDYFHRLFLAKNDSEMDTSTFPETRRSFSSSAYQSGFGSYLKQLLFQTFQQVGTASSPPTKDNDRVYEGLSSVWSQLYTWSHFYTSDMMFMMMICLGLLTIMMTSLSFLLIVWIVTQKRS